MKTYKLSMTTDILAPRIKHLTSENRALKNKVRQLESTLASVNEIVDREIIRREFIDNNITPESFPDK